MLAMQLDVRHGEAAMGEVADLSNAARQAGRFDQVALYEDILRALLQLDDMDGRRLN
ncbi:hypothetical protein TMPK1_30630 [Rhodospirillales bacterium TMPK1]|uniref:Uncharacterized protein n=2 Tax=Roseiterribacter gracilis TaxID=2812848 RepID=A0A8S8XHT6_9PROT|nr:hypothetical protein TMPK1_30630 [Rhodospirillales bacterium TMPK1]